MAKKKSDLELKAFQLRLEKITANLMRLTGKRNVSQLGKWLRKSNDRNAEMYFTSAKHHQFLDYEMIVARCIEEDIDLNEVFKDGAKGKDYNDLHSKYLKLDEQLAVLMKQNGELISENKKINESFQKISSTSQELMLKYLSTINKA